MQQVFAGHKNKVTSLKMNTVYHLDKFYSKCTKEFKKKIVLTSLLEDTLFPIFYAGYYQALVYN